MINLCPARIAAAFGEKITPPFGERAKFRMADSISPASRRLSTGITSILSDRASAWMAPHKATPTGLSGFRRTATRITLCAAPSPISSAPSFASRFKSSSPQRVSILTFRADAPACLLQPLLERCETSLTFWVSRRPIHEDADPSHTLLLCARGQWPTDGNTAEQRDEL